MLEDRTDLLRPVFSFFSNFSGLSAAENTEDASKSKGSVFVLHDIHNCLSFETLKDKNKIVDYGSAKQKKLQEKRIGTKEGKHTSKRKGKTQREKQTNRETQAVYLKEKDNDKIEQCTLFPLLGLRPKGKEKERRANLDGIGEERLGFGLDLVEERQQLEQRLEDVGAGRVAENDRRSDFWRTSAINRDQTKDNSK